MVGKPKALLAPSIAVCGEALSLDNRILSDVLYDECGYDGWCVVEQDLFPVKSFDVPLEKATIGRENLRKAGF